MDKRKGIKRDFTGIVIGYLTVLKFTGEYNKSGSLWLCRCECGEIKIIPSHDIRRGIRRGYSLSCNKCELSIRAVRSQPDQLAFNNLYSMYKSAALTTRGLDFNLTKVEFKAITKMNCYYCGCEPYQVVYNCAKSGKYIYNGIDRKNPSIGYTLDNCVPACGVCNIMKQSQTEDEFLNHIRKIVDFKSIGVNKKNIYGTNS